MPVRFFDVHRASAAALVLAGLLCGDWAAAQATVTVLRSFDSDVRTPSSIVWGSDGRLYGTNGNSIDPGGAWRMDADGANLGGQATAGVFVVTSPLVRNDAGIFFGTAEQGACPHTTSGPGGVITADFGSVFRFGSDLLVTPLVAASNRIYCPQGNLAIDAAGNLYVLDLGDGSGVMSPVTGAGDGALWKIASDQTTVTLVRAFSAATDGRATVAIVAGENSWLYGVNGTGGPVRADQPGVAVNGTLYRVRPDGSEFSVLHSFIAAEGRPATSASSKSALAEADGYLYGTTFSLADGHGSLYRIRTDGTDFSVLHRFANTPDGRRPAGELIRGGDGNLYGTTNAGGINGVGTLFRIVVAHADGAEGGYELLHSFTPGVDGRNARGRFTRGSNGMLYLAIGDGDFGKVLQIDIGYTPPRAQIVNFSGEAVSIFVGASATLNWTTSNVTACTASGAWTGGKPINGSENITLAAAGEYSFTLSCDGEDNSDSRTIVVTAAPPPVARISSFAASATSVPRGANVMLSWQARDTTGCVASGSWNGGKPNSGSENITFDTDGAYSYTLTCAGIGGDATRTLDVTVTSPPPVDARSGGGTTDAMMLALLALVAALRYRQVRIGCSERPPSQAARSDQADSGNECGQIQAGQGALP